MPIHSSLLTATHRQAQRLSDLPALSNQTRLLRTRSAERTRAYWRAVARGGIPRALEQGQTARAAQLFENLDREARADGLV